MTTAAEDSMASLMRVQSRDSLFERLGESLGAMLGGAFRALATQRGHQIRLSKQLPQDRRELCRIPASVHAPRHAILDEIRSPPNTATGAHDRNRACSHGLGGNHSSAVLYGRHYKNVEAGKCGRHGGGVSEAYEVHPRGDAQGIRHCDEAPAPLPG